MEEKDSPEIALRKLINKSIENFKYDESLYYNVVFSITIEFDNRLGGTFIFNSLRDPVWNKTYTFYADTEYELYYNILDELMHNSLYGLIVDKIK